MKTIGVIFLLFFSFLTAYSQVYLSEIMFNPVGNERYNEFVELYNAGDQDMDMTGWQVGDADRTSELLPVREKMILAPGQFAMVLVENYWLNSTDYDSLIPPKALLLTIEHSQIGSYGLSNSREETILLVDRTGVIVDSVTYTLPNDDGISEERTTYDYPFAPELWGNSVIIGGTPGFRNSISPREHDLGIIPASLSISPNPPVHGQSAQVSLSIQNLGTAAIPYAGVTLCSHLDKDTGAIPVGDTLRVYNLLPKEERSLSREMTNPPDGIFTLVAAAGCAKDANPLNDRDTLLVWGGYGPGCVLVNEIMYSPPPDCPEWYEIFNNSLDPVNLEQWYFIDNDGKRKTFLDSAFWLAPGDFAVIADDWFNIPNDNGNCQLLTPSSFPGLRNDADSVVLRDAAGNIIDRVNYQGDWGGAKGLSLERLNPNGKSDDWDNWTTCVDPEGHTAGKENSVYTPVLPSESALSITPNPFSPDGDGNADHTAISWQLTTPTSHINIRIFDIRGRQVRFLCNNRACAANGTVFWDGLDEEGLTCRIGIYLVLLENIEYGKGVTEKFTNTVVLARQL